MSDIKNIKDFLSKIYKYILDKSINNNKADDIKNPQVNKAVTKTRMWLNPFTSSHSLSLF